MKIITMSALILGLAGGAASADRWHGGGGGGRVEHREQHWNGGGGGRAWNGGGRSWSGGVRVAPTPSYRYENRRPVYVERDRWERRPIYVQRPIIRERYYNYYQRPSLIVENYDPMPGYYWVAGGWQWDGYEWIWQPGHYEPDPNYYYNGY